MREFLLVIGAAAVALVWKPLKWAHDALLPLAVRLGVHKGE